MKWSKSSKKIGRRYQSQIKKSKRIALSLLFLLLLFAAYRLLLTLDLFSQPTVSTKRGEPMAVSIFLSYIQPTLVPETPPITQLDQFVSSVSAQTYNLFPNGELTPGQDEAKINLLFAEKPSQDELKKVSWLITKINNQTPILVGYLVNEVFYFTDQNLPDIIVSPNSSKEELSISLQSIPSLAKIKEGIKIIDLRFNHPIIK